MNRRALATVNAHEPPFGKTPRLCCRSSRRATIRGMKNLLRVTLTAASLLLFAGCASQHAAPAPSGMLNTKCAVSGEALDGKGPTVDFMGGKVGFCCDKCAAKWNAMDDAGKKAALAKAK